MRVLCYPEAEVPGPLRSEMIALQQQAWPRHDRMDLPPWHDPSLTPLSMLLVDDDHVVAALDVLSKRIEHEGVWYAASGISAVVTDHRLRRRGLGRILIEAARQEMATRGADLGIFTCDSPLRTFYESGGWTCLPGTVLVGGTPEAPFPSHRFDKVTMAAFFSPKAQAHRGDFVGARVHLYPGEIDKLW